MNNIGYNNQDIYIQKVIVLKIIYKYFDNITIDNTDNCDLIIKSPLLEIYGIKK